MNKKLIVLGLDGATWDNLGTLLEKNKLQNLKKIIQVGNKNTLLSTFPPITGPAWTSLATGKTIEETKIIDFILYRDNKIESFRNFNLNKYAFWTKLSERGLRVNVLNYPTQTKAHPINGNIVTGIFGDKVFN